MTPGQLFIVAAPSGTGKTSLLKKALGELTHFSVSVSHTTRPRRAGEEHSRDYHFVRPEKFERMLKRGDFLEHARVFGHYYGTSRVEVEEKLVRGENMVLEIDWQGARQVRRSAPGTFSIFILPPSMATLRERLEKRDQDSPETIAHRLDTAHEEIRRHGEFDAVIVNHDFDRACEELKRLLSGLPPDPSEQALAEQTARALLAAGDGV